MVSIIDQFLITAGMKLAIGDAAKRYGRAIANPGEPILKLSNGPVPTPATKNSNQFLTTPLLRLTAGQITRPASTSSISNDCPRQ